MPQLQTTDQFNALHRRGAEHQQPHGNKNTIKVKHPTLPSSARQMQNQKDTKYCGTKQGPNTKALKGMGAIVKPVTFLELSSSLHVFSSILQSIF